MNEIPEWGTVPRMLRHRANNHPQSIAVLDGDTTLTLADIRAQASKVARSLISRGIGAGDPVAVWAPNCWQWVITAFGIWDCGAVVVPLSTRGKGIETAEVLRRTGCRALVAIDDFLGTSYIDQLATAAGGPSSDLPFANLPDVHTLVLLGGSKPLPGTFTWDAFLDLHDTVTLEAAERRALAVEPTDIFEILMTSGTTGQPKGVMLNGGQILRAYWDWAEVCGLGEGDRLPVVSPFAHGFGINAGMIACVERLATMVPVAVFDPDRALDMVEELGLTTLAGPPNLFSRILSDPELAQRNTSSLRWAIVGAASVPDELVVALQQQLGFERITNAYGLIEGSVVTMTRPGDPTAVVAGSAGRVVPGMEIQLVDADGQPASVGEQGEIHIRGYGVMQGYWDAPQLTADAFAPDGWLRTGDVGSLDSDGNLRIVGRTKEMLIVGGFNAYPAEIESLLLHNPKLAQAAVLGVPDDALGEVVWAFVVPNAGENPTEEEIVAWARANMSNYKAPRRVFVLDALPVTANGKIAKASLRERVGQLRTSA
ncbi:AMP-binding protein [Rhodococcus sp. USK10]|uniref:AMP-binding protein n=1 Tax=Rhodococcus sp. USK10 TaxID=2789739 RepID=UPI001C60775A|nr:AMP-binding protein [Rhodococcus sp. USK10]QYB07457.1 AMP-binding protein [Rhodococcus sp. USK10]